MRKKTKLKGKMKLKKDKVDEYEDKDEVVEEYEDEDQER